METVFKNDLVSLVWGYDGTRLDMLDSDGNFIDYFFYEEELDGDTDKHIEAKAIIDEIQNMNERELCGYVYSAFDMFKIEPYCGDIETIQELRDEWGDEYVVRVGNTALIIRE